MRWATHLGLFTLAVLLPVHAGAQGNGTFAEAKSAGPIERTETKPFNPHATHPPEQSAKPWFDLGALPAPKLAADLGNHRYDIAAANEEARAFFNQGLIYAYGFNHLEALRAFRHAQTLDPNCAMCFWGEAYVLGPNLNLPMETTAAPIARAAAEKAVAKATKASAKEQALAAALLVRYTEPGERADLDRRYAEAMQGVARSFPDDPDIAALAAESLMLLSPWDYWLEFGRSPKENTAKALALLEAALATNPDHIAAIHFYIHLVEASDRPQRAEPYADRLRDAVRGAGHLLHMPAHIYLRMGRYKDVLEVNKDAAASDERYLAANPGVQGPYPAMYYPHNVHFQMTAALMAGQGESALSSADKLAQLIPDEAAQAIPAAQPIKQAPYFIHAQFSDPQDDPGSSLPERKTSVRGRCLAICAGNCILVDGKTRGSRSGSRRDRYHYFRRSKPARASQHPRCAEFWRLQKRSCAPKQLPHAAISREPDSLQNPLSIYRTSFPIWSRPTGTFQSTKPLAQSC